MKGHTFKMTLCCGPEDRDLRPLKHFRPPLRSDPSNLVTKIVHLTLSSKEKFSHKKASHKSVQDRLKLKPAPTLTNGKASNGSKSVSGVIEKNDIGLTDADWSADEIRHELSNTTQSTFNSTKSAEPNSAFHGRSAVGSYNLENSGRNLATTFDVPKNYRVLIDCHASEVDSDSGVEVSPRKLSSSISNISSVTSDVLINGDVSGSHKFKSKIARGELTSLNSSFVDASNSSDIWSLSSDDEIEPVSPRLLPVPNHLRRYSPVVEMDRPESSGSIDGSSGIASSDSIRSYSDEPVLKHARLKFEETESRCDVQEKCHNTYSRSEETLPKTLLGNLVNGTPLSLLTDLGLPSSFGKQSNLKRKASYSLKESALGDIVTDCFSKKFKFVPANWTLPDVSEMFTSEPWELSQFQTLKRKLNEVKDQLNDLPLQDWHKHTAARNRSGSVIWQLKRQVAPELPTQAWCKFYEMVSTYSLVPDKAIKNRSLNTVHLCEAPGAFVAALNHFLCSQYGSDFHWDWRATTLNPYYEGNPLSLMINDDRFILQTLKKWTFGEDFSGDLREKSNFHHLIHATSSFKEILLVTADGSFDCMDNPAEQEEIVSWLHYCETIAAVHLLSPGGSFLLKMFTFYESSSICLMYFLNCAFRTVHVYKPVTSKAGNSEVYVICCGFFGEERLGPWLRVLQGLYGATAPSTTMFSSSQLPEDFVNQMYNCAEFFKNHQTRTINENLRTFKTTNARDKHLTAALRHRVATEFFERFSVPKIDVLDHIVDKKQLDHAILPNVDSRDGYGSFNDRQKRLGLTPAEEIKCLQDDLNHLKFAWPCDSDIFWMDFPANAEGFGIIQGKPITVVNSSKFCLGRLLYIRNRIRDIARNHFQLRMETLNTQGHVQRKFEWPIQNSEGKVRILDFKDTLWASLEKGCNAYHEKIACRDIITIVDDLWRHDNLALCGYPMLTLFNVGLIYLLGHLFEKVGFLRPQGQDIVVLFFNFRQWNPAMKDHWEKVIDVMGKNGEAVLSVVSVNRLSDGDFYKYVTEINNLCVVEQVRELLRCMPSTE